eukprot:TRINITY_DN5732_c0_g1_i1.p1 TRINITY_DN5732_c0_g1~~TRINITY_DN5732_c0_g1_i1.p1  ORF type:complete len:166 (+),score=10.89 TRINITY_DN5732_c0_g1_i1:46-498(+)
MFNDIDPLVPYRWCPPEVLREGILRRNPGCAQSSRTSSLTTPQSDVWMIGIALWELSNSPYHQPFFKRKDFNEIIAEFEQGPNLQFVFEEYNSEWYALIQEACSIDPEKRPTAQQLLHDVTKLTRQKPVRQIEKEKVTELGRRTDYVLGD